MAIDTLLERLGKVRRSGNGYMACCPAHDDRNPSLSIDETDDGRVLIHCFAECASDDILNAVGLTYADLNPPTTLARSKEPAKRKPLATDVLRCLAFEALVIQQCANTVMRGETLSEADHQSLTRAVARFQKAEGLFDA